MNNFGGFGQQGYGYSVNYLYEEIGNILGLNKEYQLVVVGYGRLGQAMASYIYKNERIFISEESLTLRKSSVTEFEDAEILTCRSLAGFVKEATHRYRGHHGTGRAQIVADTVSDAGIKAIWNFTAVDLELPVDGGGERTCQRQLARVDLLYAGYAARGRGLGDEGAHGAHGRTPLRKVLLSIFRKYHFAIFLHKKKATGLLTGCFFTSYVCRM